MKRTKKFLSLSLVLLLVTAMFGGVGAFADSAAVKSDSPSRITLRQGSTYTFKFTVSTGSSAPSVTVGNGEILQTQKVGQKGNDFYFKISPIGDPGDTTSVYTALAGQKPECQCVVTLTDKRGNTDLKPYKDGGLRQGDWVYFRNDDDYKLYKINVNGSGQTKLYDSQIYSLDMQDDWVYFTNKATDLLYKIRTDGSNLTKINTITYTLDVEGNWIYYTDNNNNLYRMHTDGTGRTKLCNKEMESFTVENDLIYFIDNGDLYKIHTDGTGLTAVNSKDDCTGFQVSGNWIYYTTDNCVFSSGAPLYGYSEFYRMHRDGTNRTKLTNDNVSVFSVKGDWISYENNYDESIPNSDGKFYKMRTDGTDKQEFKPSPNI